MGLGMTRRVLAQYFATCAWSDGAWGVHVLGVERHLRPVVGACDRIGRPASDGDEGECEAAGESGR